MPLQNHGTVQDIDFNEPELLASRFRKCIAQQQLFHVDHRCDIHQNGTLSVKLGRTLGNAVHSMAGVDSVRR